MSEEPNLEEVLRIAEQFQQLPEPAKRWMEEIIQMLHDDESGEFHTLMARWGAGERVVEDYVDADTGEVVQVAESERSTTQHLPLFPGMAREVVA